MNEEKLYLDVDYPLSWKKYKFYMKNHTNFVAFCEQDGGDKWRLVEMCGRNVYAPYPKIDINKENIDYFVDMKLWA